MVNPQVWNEILVGLKGSPRSDIKCLSEKRAWADFHRNWIGTMRFLTEKKGNNYFLPEVVGGLGLVPPSSLYFWTTLRQNYAISIVGKSLNKEGKSPKFRTRVVPVTKSLNGVTRKIVNKTPMGVVDFDTERPEFSGTARVKSITTNTKLYTAFLPKGECKARPTLNELASWCYGNLHSQGKPSLAEKLLERLGLQGSDGLVAVPNE